MGTIIMLAILFAFAVSANALEARSAPGIAAQTAAELAAKARAGGDGFVSIKQDLHVGDVVTGSIRRLHYFADGTYSCNDANLALPGDVGGNRRRRRLLTGDAICYSGNT